MASQSVHKDEQEEGLPMNRHGESVAPCIKVRARRLQTWNYGRTPSNQSGQADQRSSRLHQAACVAHGDRDILIEQDPRNGITTTSAMGVNTSEDLLSDPIPMSHKFKVQCDQGMKSMRNGKRKSIARGNTADSYSLIQY